MHLTFVFGTRPETIKMAPLILAARKLGHRAEVVLTGQHREMARQMLRVFGIEADLDLGVMVPNQTLAGLSARVLLALDEKLSPSVKRDWLLVQGDTTTAFIAGYWAFMRGIPVAHVEAGLRTHDLRAPFPEEANRQLLSRIATMHFAPTAQAARALGREGIPRALVKVVGNSGIDALLWVVERLKRPGSGGVSAEDRLPRDLLAQLGDRRVVLITAHRRESFGPDFDDLCMGIQTAALKHSDCVFVYPVHPNPNVRAPVEKWLSGIPNVLVIEPLSYVPFIELMMRASALLTDSGGMQEEAPTLKKPVIVMRNTTERPEGVKAGFSRLVGTDSRKIEQAVTRALKRGCEGRGKNPYGDGKASERMIRALNRCS
mgnify:CR=1 FL=1